VVTLLCGADEVVVRSIEQLRHRLEFTGIAVCKRLRSDAFGARRLLHLLAVFVSPRQEEDILAVEALVARHGIGRNQLVGMADMRLAVGIGDRGRDVEGGLVCHGGQFRLTL